ncbi:MAG: VCBS domain-containing protein [Piscinibacter sp.]
MTDADAGQASFQAQASTAGTYGTFTLGTNGAWTYTAANANPTIQALGAGQTLTETFTVRSADGRPRPVVVVTINGSNDVAVISAGTGSVTEDVAVSGGNIATGGTLTVTDTDAGQCLLPGASLDGRYLRHASRWPPTARGPTPPPTAIRPSRHSAPVRR